MRDGLQSQRLCGVFKLRLILVVRTPPSLLAAIFPSVVVVSIRIQLLFFLCMCFIFWVFKAQSSLNIWAQCLFCEYIPGIWSYARRLFDMTSPQWSSARHPDNDQRLSPLTSSRSVHRDRVSLSDASELLHAGEGLEKERGTGRIEWRPGEERVSRRHPRSRSVGFQAWERMTVASGMRESGWWWGWPWSRRNVFNVSTSYPPSLMW